MVSKRHQGEALPGAVSIMIARGVRGEHTFPMGCESDEDDAHFLNVDLDILSRAPLEPLVAGFGKKVLVLYVGKEGRRFGAHLELAKSHGKNADRAIRDLAALVCKLPKPARRLWNEAQSRDFNIGIQSGSKPRMYELHVTASTLEAVAALGARLTVTTYAAEPLRDRQPAKDVRSRGTMDAQLSGARR
jgi:hypothetical protein